MAQTFYPHAEAYLRSTPVAFHVENVLRHLLAFRNDPARAHLTIELYAQVLPGQQDPEISRVIRLTDLYPSAANPPRVLDAALPTTFGQKIFPKDGKIKATLRVFKRPSTRPLIVLADAALDMRIEVVYITGATDKTVERRAEAVVNHLRGS
ncbi:hypothetical protein A1O3_01728 [Capronia epimyces CBS 606.96]|uniref:Uncharacterized protein n=1 Tax=Capronia epimyces CBS 606.96 TaxID=1182542 RepID=W9YV77_9EURO|nr:uncharacterized protein A1O3_01728 [Capronia epimyces CBS 606.96]EXJ93171.1 hypothetical protein A1O3_01728 [Capronia epimyces CBS 606.96]